MKLRRVSLFLCGLLVAFAAFAAVEIDPQVYLGDVKYLASEKMKGRGDGTPELEKAADYIAKQFREFGLKPAGDKGYYQALKVTTNAKLGSHNRFDYTDGKEKVSLKFNEQFRPMTFSSSGHLSGPVVFAGYGITAPEYKYDDYAGIDAKGKLVLVLRHEPQEFDDNSVLAGKVYTSHAQFMSKAVNAKFHGALGVIFINDKNNHPSESDEMERFSDAVGPAGAGIPFVQVKAEVAERWLALAGKTLDGIGAAINKDLHPQSFSLPPSLHVEISVDIERQVRTIHNVAGYLPGETSEYLIIGAHYDHLGLGEQFSMAPSQIGTPHPGADDNASGTAGVIELARWFSSRPKPKRGILFLTFAGEEIGLLGSSFYANHPELPLNNAVAMINMDMIGRVRQGRVYVGGVGTGSNFKQTLQELNGNHKLNLDFSDVGGYGSSDHFSFTPKHVPVLFFFSGLHADYHKPSDTWDKITAPQTAELLDYIAAVSEKLLDEPGRPEFVKVDEPQPHSAIAASSSGSGYGPYFGSVPDFAESSDGVRFADIRGGSPADQAGIKAGDVLIEFDGKPIQNLYDFTYALRSKKPGDKVAVKVRRRDGVIEATVTLAERK